MSSGKGASRNAAPCLGGGKLLLDRRGLLRAGLGAAALTLQLPRRGTAAEADPPPDLDAARKEGPLVVWHTDQEPDMVQFLKAFTEKTGIATSQQRILPGAAMPKLQAEFRAGVSDADVYDSSDTGMMEQLRKQGNLLRYQSRELGAYAPEYKSDPPGFWTVYFVTAGPMMYDPRHVKEAEAPKTWMDLLDPRWQGQIAFQDSAAGSQYGWWFLLKEVLPADYWDRLAAQKPRAYASSTQIMTDIQSGNMKIGGKVSAFQYVKALRNKEPVRVVFPPEGTPAQNQVTGIIGNTKRPNAAKAFIDYMLSQEGQLLWNTVQGSQSIRPDVKIPEAAFMESAKLLFIKDFAEYESTATHARFVKLWNKVTGL